MGTRIDDLERRQDALGRAVVDVEEALRALRVDVRMRLPNPHGVLGRLSSLEQQLAQMRNSLADLRDSSMREMDKLKSRLERRSGKDRRRG